MKFGLSQEEITRLNDLFGQYPWIQEAIIFGSRAEGISRHSSDIDLALKTDKTNLSDILSLKSKIDDLSLPYTVDLINYEKLQNQELKKHIDQSGQVFYQRT